MLRYVDFRAQQTTQRLIQRQFLQFLLPGLVRQLSLLQASQYFENERLIYGCLNTNMADTKSVQKPRQGWIFFSLDGGN